MKKLKAVQYLAYITLILVIFSILSGEAFATSSLSKNENGNQYAEESIVDAENYEKDSSEDTNVTGNSSYKNLQEENRTRILDKDKFSAYQSEKKQIHEALQLQKSKYREIKEDFLKIRTQIQTGKLNPNSEKAVDATKTYLNSSINYMVAHLKNVKTNMQYSTGNGTEERIVAMDENIKLLEAEQAAVANASSQQELITAIRSVREVWTNAQKTSLTGAGQIVSQKIGEFLDKSENLSGKLDTEIQSLNRTGVDTSDLQTRLASYNLYIKVAQEKKAAADSIYEDENTTQEDLEIANNHLRESLNNVNKANKILKVIFGDLKEYHLEEVNKIGVENSTETELNNITSNNTNSNLSV